MRRAVFYLFYDPQGQVDDYVLHTLGTCARTPSTSSWSPTPPSTSARPARLETVADRVWERENIGFDVWAYKEADGGLRRRAAGRATTRSS